MTGVPVRSFRGSGPWALVVAALVGQSALAAQLVRGPYLQRATPTEVTVVFRTDVAAVGRVRFGAVPGPLTGSVADLMSGTEHVLRLTGLQAGTRYAYAVDLDGLSALEGEELRFRTYPLPGTDEAFRMFVWGDSGSADANQMAVADRLATQLGGAALSLILGDIVYPDGEPWEYDRRYFTPYAPLLRRHVIWPTVGNHDVIYDPSGGPYRDAFVLPTNNPASSELYYSFDYGPAHFVCLDTHVNAFTPGAPQLVWAAQDLAASTAKWKFAYFHVPPYTGGTHNDNAAVQAGIVPVLEDAGVDVVFTGHSHVYERTYLLRQGAIVQNDPLTYVKTSPTDGTLYVVSGTAGQTGGLGRSGHPLMAYQRGNTLGSAVIDVQGDSLHGYFLLPDGGARDLFRLTKGPDVTAPKVLEARALSPTEVLVAFDEPVAAGAAVGGAEHLPSYSIAPAVSVTAAVLFGDLRTVQLTTAPHAPGPYTVTVSNVKDRAAVGNAVVPTGARYVVLGADAGLVDAGADAGSNVDAGSADAGASDAGFDDAGLDAGGADAGVVDAGVVDGGATDAGVPDAGATDGGVADAGLDAGTPDAGGPDASVDGGLADAGSSDAGPLTDAGPVDAGLTDAGGDRSDAGLDAGAGQSFQGGGCGCAAVEPGWLLGLLALARRRRRS